MRVDVTAFPDARQLGEVVAARVVAGIEQAGRLGRPYVLGCPGGRSPVSTYAALARLVRARHVDLSGAVIAMMDDYVEPDGRGGFVRIDASLPHSCSRFGRERIVEPLSEAAGPGRGVRPDGFWLPDPREPGAYDERIAAAGGVDLFLLASGASDGHVALNPPGTARSTTTRVVQLAESTRRDNLVTFPALGSLDRVPHHGVTVGIDTIARHSRSAVMIAVGRDKRRAVARLAAADGYDPEWPATVLSECADPSLLVDAAASTEDPTDPARAGS